MRILWGFLLLLCLTSCGSSLHPPASYQKEKAQVCKDRALAYYKVGQLPEALRDALLAKEAAPHDPEVYNILGLIYMARKEYDKALASFNKALEINPKYSEALNNIGSIFLVKKDYSKALEYFFKALNNPLYEKPFIALTNIAQVYYLQGKKSEASKFLTQALQYNPCYSLAYFYLGLISLEEGKWEEAQLYLKRAVKFNRRDMAARYYLALTFFRLGDEDKAIQIWKSIIQLAPETEWSFKAENMLLSLDKEKE